MEEEEIDLSSNSKKRNVELNEEEEERDIFAINLERISQSSKLKAMKGQNCRKVIPDYSLRKAAVMGINRGFSAEEKRKIKKIERCVKSWVIRFRFRKLVRLAIAEKTQKQFCKPKFFPPFLNVLKREKRRTVQEKLQGESGCKQD